MRPVMAIVTVIPIVIGAGSVQLSAILGIVHK